MSEPPVPTGLQPRGGITVGTNNPTISCNLGASVVFPGLRVKAHFKLATDSGFTTDVREWTQPDSKLIVQGAARAPVPASLSLFQGTWFVTAFSVQEGTLSESDPSFTYSFVVDHPIIAVAEAPVANKVVDVNATPAVRHSWHHTDTEPLGRQTKFQVIVEKLDATPVHDSGTITSIAEYYDETDSASYPDEDLRWNVYLWDEDDIQGTPSDWAVYKPSAGGALSLDAPSGTIDTPAPTVSWTYTPVDGRAQVAYQVAVYQTDGLLLFYTGFIAGAATSYVLPGSALKNGHSYIIAVFVKDSGDIVVQQSGTFAVAFTPPASATTSADATNYATTGAVAVTWTGTPDGDFVFWRVYRKPSTSDVYTKISADITASGTSSFDDFSAPAGVSLDYAAVQVKSIAGALVESDPAPATVTTAAVAEYWLVDVDPGGVHMHLTQVTQDDFADETEQEEMLIIGRGRRIEQGTEWGYRGTATAELYDISGGLTAREQRLLIQDLKRNAGACFLRNPFGDSWRVVPGEIGVSRIAGVGLREFVTVTIPYAEVF